MSNRINIENSVDLFFRFFEDWFVDVNASIVDQHCRFAMSLANGLGDGMEFFSFGDVALVVKDSGCR